MKESAKTIYPKACYFCGRRITAKRPQMKPMPRGIKAYICKKCKRKEKEVKDGSRTD